MDYTLHRTQEESKAHENESNNNFTDLGNNGDNGKHDIAGGQESL